VSDVKGLGTTADKRSTQTRAKIIQAAYDLFCQVGFRETTMAAIGTKAGVSVQTVYFQFRTKDQVLQAVHEWTVLGDDGLPPALQPWYLAAVREPAVTYLEKVVAGTARLNARIAPTLPIFAALAKEPGGEIYRNSRRLRRDGMDVIVAALRDKAGLRKGMTAARAADLLDFLMGPESYAALVLHDGWTQRHWITWVSRTLAEQLLDPGPN
jgi:AcrR family transcriptional regulator